jgi:histidine triad (HIT) family protein
MPETSENQPLAGRACTFCRIVRREEEAAVVCEDDLSLAFLDHRPLFPGHCLLVPKAHYETLAELPAWLVGPLFQNAQLLERAIEEGLGADGTFVALNNVVSQSVPHAHIHLVPRHRKDGLKGFFWPRQRYPDDAALRQMQETLREVCARLRSRL